MEQAVVIGLGGVGLPFAVALASRGVGVTGFDRDAGKVDRLGRGESGMLDEGLDAALGQALASGAIQFTERLEPAEAPRAFVIAVPTPVDADGTFVSEPLDAAFAAIEAVARDGDLVLVRSTTPVGTLRRFAARTGERFALAACPDRSMAGQAFADQFATPHLVGGLTAGAGDRAQALLERLGPVVRVGTSETAEAAKLFTNVWRDARFALANQLALFCEDAGVDYEQVRAAAAEGFPRFHAPRAGPVGGPCLSKDVFLLAAGGDADLYVQARAVNGRLAGATAKRVLDELDARGGGHVAVLGLAFKGAPATNDRRGAFAQTLIARLSALRPGLETRTWDPVTETQEMAREALAGACVIVLANDHPALADAALYALCADQAFVYDLCGVLANTRAMRPNLVVRRFGQGSPP